MASSISAIVQGTSSLSLRPGVRGNSQSSSSPVFCPPGTQCQGKAAEVALIVAKSNHHICTCQAFPDLRPGNFLESATPPQIQRQIRKMRRRAAAPSRKVQAAASGSGPTEVSSFNFSETYLMWDTVTNTLTVCSTVANLLMMMPQILKNAQALAANKPQELAGLSWIAFTTGYLGNMLLLSYFTEQKQSSACLVQVVGAASTLTLLSQIWLAGFMPQTSFAAVAGFFLIGCLVNALRLANALPGGIWSTWQDFLGILGLSVLPQVIWSSFSSVKTNLPGIVAVLVGLACVLPIRLGKAPQALVNTWHKLGGWTATLLFMFMPVAQLQACMANPANLGTLSPVFSILGLVGNGLMIPRALFTGDLIWFTGSSWGAVMMGWCMLLAMTTHSFFPRNIFGSITVAFFAYLLTILIINAKALSLKSPLASFANLRG